MDTENNTQKPQFKPLTEGLGINHFADGLPYAPASQRNRPNVSHPPMTRFVYNEPVQKPVARKSAEAVLEEALTVAQEEDFPRYAGFLRRMSAFALDVAFVSAIFCLVVWASFTLNGLEVKAALFDQKGFQIFWLLFMLFAVVHAGYFLIQELSWKTTLGKALLGIQIRSSSGFATVGRAICFFIAAAPLGIGLFWYFFDSKGRCWHDVITDSEVVVV